MAKKTKWFLVVLVLVLLGIVYCGTIAVGYRHNRSAIRFHSDMSYTNACIREALREYYMKEGRYPNDLDILKEAIVKGSYVGTVPERPRELELLPMLPD